MFAICEFYEMNLIVRQKGGYKKQIPLFKMKKSILSALVILFGFVSLNAQNSISGTIVSEKLRKPIEYVSVYVDGTAKGTTTDSVGHFTIKNLNFPCRLVVSCVGYELKSFQLSSATEENLNIELREQTEQLSAISVNGKSRRKQNLELFKKAFIGDDKWGQHTKLVQEDGLLFEHHYDTIKVKKAFKDVEYFHTFNVNTRSPLTVRLPLLGYDAAVDIVSFRVKTCSYNQTTEYDMYSRFTPHKFTSERQRKKIENNRREVYYNSPIYFCSSLFNDKLKQNGFITTTTNGFSAQYEIKYVEFDLRPYIVNTSEDEIAIMGLKGKTIRISYYYNSKKYPVNLESYLISEGKPIFPKRVFCKEQSSEITFFSDTCIIYKNGTIADNNIVFSGNMATYAGSRLLPLDYNPKVSSSEEKYNVPPKTEISNSKPYTKIKPETSADQNIKKITKEIQSYTDEYPQEKVYLHFDNTSYYLGETIWFKAYVVQADRNNLTTLSKVLYVELLNAEGHLLDSRKLKIENGACNGEFKLNPIQYGGYYEVRAYTRYMLNVEGNFFSRVFPVYDKPNQEGQYKAVLTERPRSQRIEQKRPEYNQSHKLGLSFFPEGGSLVQGINSKVAFKATNDEGEEVPVNCTLYRNQKDSICSFDTQYKGMGSFEFRPDSAKYSVVTHWQGKKYQFPLPEVLNSGISLSVDNSEDDNIYIEVRKTHDIKNQALGITLNCRGRLYGSDTFTMNQDSIIGLNFSKRKLPSGVTQITLFDEQGKILSERLVFVNHHSQMKFSCSQNKTEYNPFEPVTLSFLLKDNQDKPVETSFSLSVRDAGTSSLQPKADNILTDLLLSSEVKGYISNPDYYFESESPERRAALDLLLRVQGWSRYSWKQMAGIEKTEQKQTLEDGLYVDGSVVSLLLNKPKPKMNFTMVLLADSTSQRGTCKTDSTGNFCFRLIDFSGTARLILQTKQDQEKTETVIKLNRQFSPALKTYTYAEQNETQVYKIMKDSTIAIDSLMPGFEEEIKKLLPANNDKLSMTSRNNLLKQVTVKVKRMPVKVSVKYEVEKEMDRRTDLAEWIPANLNTLLNFTCKYYTDGRYKSKNVKFIVENSNQIVSDVNNIMEGNDEPNSFSTDSKPQAENSDGTTKDKDKDKTPNAPLPNLDEIESITFIEDYASIYRLCGGGNIEPSSTCIGLIKLKKNYVKEPYSIRNTNFEGYSLARTFFCPQYDKVVMPNEKDYRRTLYWNPNVQTNKEGKTTVTFYNNGSCNSMLINAETVTSNGMMGVMNR